MDGLEGVRIEVSLGGMPLAVVEEDGYVGKLTPGLAKIKVEFSPERSVYGCVVGQRTSGKKEISTLRVRGDRTSPRYVKGVRIGRKYVGLPPAVEIPTALYPNSLRLVEEKPRGLFEVWEVALISQMGNFFLTVQKNFEMRACRDGEQVVFPGFENWPHGGELEAIQDFVLPLLAGKFEELESLDSCQQPQADASANGLDQRTGQVLWWNYAQGLGAILTSKGPARVRWWNIAKRPRLAFLEQGEKVRYIRLLRPVTRHYTHFEWEAMGVRAVEG